MRLIEIPIEIYDKKEEDITGEAGYFPSVMTVDVEKIQYAFRDGDNKANQTIICHAHSRDTTTVLIPYEKFVELWRGGLAGNPTVEPAGTVEGKAEPCIVCGGVIICQDGVNVCGKCGVGFQEKSAGNV